MPRPASAGRWERVERADALEQVDDRRLAHVGALAGGARVARRGLGQAIAGRGEHAIGLPGTDDAVCDQLGRERDEIVRDGDVFLMRPLLHVGRRSPRLAGGLQVTALQLGQRALREDREARDALDVVAEQLDAHRLGARRREHVEDVTTHGQLAAVADTIDACVSGSDERGDGLVAHELAPALRVQGRGPALRRRDTLDQRGRGDGHDATGLEQPETPGALADEVWRGLEPRAVGDAARGHEADHVGGRVPGRLVGYLARRFVVVDEHRQAGPRLAAAALPERRQQGRECGFGNACTRRQRRFERARELRDTGLRGDLVRDGRQVGEVRFERSVHAFGRHGAGGCRIASGP